MIYYGKLLDKELKDIPVKCVQYIGILFLLFTVYGIIITNLFSLL